MPNLDFFLMVSNPLTPSTLHIDGISQVLTPCTFAQLPPQIQAIFNTSPTKRFFFGSFSNFTVFGGGFNVDIQFQQNTTFWSWSMAFILSNCVMNPNPQNWSRNQAANPFNPSKQFRVTVNCQ